MTLRSRNAGRPAGAHLNQEIEEMSKPAPEAKKTTCRLVYIGRRVSGDAVYQVFSRDGRYQHGYTGIKLVRIGHTYEGELDGERVSISTMPRELDEPRADEGDVETWEAQDAAAAQWKRRKAMATKLAREPELARLIADRLAPIMRQMTRPSEARQLVEFIIDLAWRERGKK